MKSLRLLLAAITMLGCVLVCEGISQDGWTKEGGLRRWRGAEIVNPQYGCSSVSGNPIVEFQDAIAEVDLVSGSTTNRTKPKDGQWEYIPRNPNLVIQVERDSAAGTTTMHLYNIVEGGLVRDLVAEASTLMLEPDPADSWCADDGSIGAIVFAPTSATPSDSLHYVVVMFDKTGSTLVKKIKPKVDVDIYTRPDPDEAGVLVYVRGNGLQISGYQDEVFTNASYLYFTLDGAVKQLSLPERRPGSGKGRKIIWHSNKYDRLVFSDEYASGVLLVKASNGIPIDTVEHLSFEASSPLRIISASGNKTDKWMVTHAKTGDKNALVLWAMPELREVTSVMLETSDPAIKQMPLSPWSVVIPILSVSQSGKALYAWDAQDVLSVNEHQSSVRATSSPLPTSHYVSIPCEELSAVDYRVVNSVGQEVLRGNGIASSGALTIDVHQLKNGTYTIVLNDASVQNATSTMLPVVTSSIVVLH